MKSKFKQRTRDIKERTREILKIKQLEDAVRATKKCLKCWEDN